MATFPQARDRPFPAGSTLPTVDEGKAESELTNPVVVAKRDAAREWVNTVNAASEVQDRWGYLLAGEKVTAAAGTWAELRAASQTHGPA